MGRLRQVLLVAATALGLAAPGVAQAQASQQLVAVTDQAGSGAIRVYDAAATDWNAAGAQKWSWKPSSANGFGDLTGYWGAPTEAKLRTDRSGHKVVVTADSKGLAAVVSYPSGKRVWGGKPGGNTHSAELLPDGNVAVASSTGKFVRVYTASQGPAASKYVQYDLDQAHGVYWDSGRKVLWALGHDELVALKVGGTPAAPKLSRTSSWALPTKDGHDLVPNPANADLLWVSTGSAVYEFSKAQNKEVATHAVKGVKSINSMADGTVLTTQPKPGMTPDWCTDTVNIWQPIGSFEHKGSRTVKSVKMYKARVW
ncbi:DUF6528 family protein [Kutzneria albida]|uniref:Secreted protein n=1 Tax=Kutzneria albida DSM 43870 TaxID=1449976 RepID=W5W7I2_9PSEU|nr:DUF6528 family protein [Kutzneria albida]AHH96665.1 hypothetical protein KALB_3298 [Kutzneria albida DSM 43870]